MATTAVQWKLCGTNFRGNISNLWVSCYNGNKICIVLYFDNILFYLIWKNYFLIKREKISILRSNIFLKNTVDTNPRLSLSHYTDTGGRLWSTGSDRSQSSVVNSMQMGPSETAVVQISWTKYIMKCYNDMVDQIPPKRILWPWNQWESHCGLSRRAGRSRGRSPSDRPAQRDNPLGSWCQQHTPIHD